MSDVARTAAAILHLMGPDPDADLHVATMLRDLGGICAIYRCERPHRSLGLCDMHLQRHKRAVSAEAFTINRKAIA